MEKQIVDRVKQLWQTWDIRSFMLISLLIQALLTFLAPFRKICAKSYFKSLMYILYLSADSVALFTIGLIASNQEGSPEKVKLLAFWAPFLLLHLGGPDTITALALEDNELWHRHALQLAAQVVTTLYVVFGLSVTGQPNNIRLLIPPVLMFIDGFTKYAERTCALYFASVDVIRDSLEEPAAPNYIEMVEEYNSARDANIPCRFEVMYGPTSVRRTDYCQEDTNCVDDATAVNLNEWNPVEETDDMISYAYQFYEKSKGLLAEAFLSLKDDGEIRLFFLNESAEKAFRILEIELNLMYDVLHTKVLLANRKRIYFRVISFLSVTASLLLFSYWDKSNYSRIDVGVTFALLGGAIFLDIASFIMFVLSDWCIILVSQHSTPKILKSFLKKLHYLSRCARNPYPSRWSESIAQYNLLNRSFRDDPPFLNNIPVKQIKDGLIDWIYVEQKLLEKSSILKFIIVELQEKAKLAADDIETIQQICSARGNLVLQYDYVLISEYLSRWTLEIDFDESVLTWHLATDICYWTTLDDKKEEKYCKLSKDISDYMSYLLLRQPGLVSQVVGRSNVRFEDTMKDVRASPVKKNRNQRVDDLSRQFSDSVQEGEIDENSAYIAKAKDSQSVYYEACCLAKQLTMLGNQQWEVMSKVWVEMLCYAAIRSSTKPHFSQLRNGGELITFVWLLMVHLGLREPIQPNRGLRATKLTICK